MQSLTSVTNDQDLMFSSINLERTVNHYETIIDLGNKDSCNYWCLGLAYLLQERELDAQATWFIPFAEASELETIVFTDELSDLLDRVASQEFANHNFEHSWLISQYLREIDATHVNNLIRSIALTIKLDLFDPECLGEWQGVSILANNSNCEVDREILEIAVRLLLGFPAKLTCEFIRQCLFSFTINRSPLIELIGNDLLILSHRFGSRDRKSTRLNSSHRNTSRMPSSA